MNEQPSERLPESEPTALSLQDLSDDDLNILIVDLAERTKTETDNAELMADLGAATSESTRRHPRYIEDPAGNTPGARSDLDDLRVKP
jgi:hypothetical protein